jgi:hypothetical protein
MAIGDKSYTVEINDSEFEREGWKRGRYKGTKLISSKINKFTEGDITFGREPVIEQFSRTVYVFNQADNSFESLAGIFYPTTDEFNQTLNDKRIIGSTRFKIDRAITFTIGNPKDFSQIEPGVDKDDPTFNYFDTLVKTDFSLFSSCSVKFFDNTNNGFVKPKYTVGYNRGDFNPAVAFFQSASTSTNVSASINESSFQYGIDNNSRLYINPNVEDWFIAQNGASGSQGTLGGGNTAITIDHIGDKDDVNSVEGYFFGLSSRLGSKNDSYYISFDQGNGGPGTLSQKNLLKAFDVHELEDSGSNIDISSNNFNIKTTGRYGGNFKTTYDGSSLEEFVLFRENTSNNTVHLDFNLSTEAPAGVGNGGVIIPDNLHPSIKESLNVYLGNAGLGAQGGTTAQFGLGGAVQSVAAANNLQLATGPIGFQGSDIEELARTATSRDIPGDFAAQLKATQAAIAEESAQRASIIEASEQATKTAAGAAILASGFLGLNETVSGLQDDVEGLGTDISAIQNIPDIQVALKLDLGAAEIIDTKGEG